PIAFVVEVQRSCVGQPLPPVPRQPARQTLFVSSQTRPELGPPQSASVSHPHCPFGRQAPPAPSGSQLVVFVGVHSPQVFWGVQTWLPGQSPSVVHCTQLLVVGSHTGVGSAHCVSSAQPVTHVPV